MMTTETRVEMMRRAASAPRYAPEIRQAVHLRIFELRKQGNAINKVAEVMRLEGFKNPDGTPINLTQVKNQISAMNHKARKARNRKVNGPAPVTTIYQKPAQQSDDWQAFVGDILATTMEPSLKLRVIKTYLEGINA